jgi:hypothetical protein
MENKSLNTIGRQLQTNLQAALTHLDTRAKINARAEKVHIAGAGGVVTAAYEQLRIAAENAEEHVLLQRAIRRFYRRLFLTKDEKLVKVSGEELAIELTQAGYLPNDSIPEPLLKQISALAYDYYASYEDLLKKRHAHKQVEHWTLEVLAVRIEWLINDPTLTSAYVQFVYDYYNSSGKAQSLFAQVPSDFDTSLYVAIHRALLKSDLASIRAGLLSRYGQEPDRIEQFVQINQQIDALLGSPTVERLYRYIDRHGAPLRVFKHLIEDDPDIPARLGNANELLSSFEAQIEAEYKAITTRINRGIIKSVIFLIITKFLIGLAIEIPYDYLVSGAIIVAPLLINLLFPPLYMILLRGTLMLPSAANSQRLSQQLEEILYGEPRKQLERKQQASFGVGYNIAYGLAFFIVFGGIGCWLHTAFEFELLHLFVFFLFLSGASFLGFRLSRLIREVEAIDSDQNAITTVRDFLYMPFVVVGRYMSEKYAQLNIVALTLDMLIELPLKTILRLIRQWAAFIGSKQDQL